MAVLKKFRSRWWSQSDLQYDPDKPAATLELLTSKPMTSCPSWARQHSVVKPTYPSPKTAILIETADSPRPCSGAAIRFRPTEAAFQIQAKLGSYPLSEPTAPFG